MHSAPKAQWEAQRLRIGLRAGAGALFACMFVPLISLLLGFIPWALLFLVEALWMLKQRRKWVQLSALAPCSHAQAGGKASSDKAWAAFNSVSQSMQEMNHNPSNWLSEWFKGADVGKLSVDNVANLLAATSWGCSRGRVHAMGFKDELDQMVAILEEQCHHASSQPSTPPSQVAAAGVAAPAPAPAVLEPNATSQLATPQRFRFRTGSQVVECPLAGPSPSFYAHTEPLPHWYRPVLMYGAFEFIRWTNKNMLTWGGFKARHAHGLTYYTYGMQDARSCPERGTPCVPPVVLLHGVGCGLLPYLKLLVALASTGAPVLAVEFPHIGQCWCSKVPSLLELRDSVLGILKLHGAAGPGGSGAHILGHSFGTAVASTILQAEPDAVASLALLDPICIHMWEPSLLINFIYRPSSFFHPKSDLGLSRSSSNGNKMCAVNSSSTGRAGYGIRSQSSLVDLGIGVSSEGGHVTSTTPCMHASSSSTHRRYGGNERSIATSVCADEHTASLNSSNTSSSTCSARTSFECTALTAPHSSCAHGCALAEGKGTRAQSHSAACATGMGFSSCSSMAGAVGFCVEGVWRLMWWWVWALPCQLLRVLLKKGGIIVKELMLLGPAREMHCAAALCRRMDWRDASLSAHAMAPLALRGKVLLVLSAKDELLPAPLLASWAENHVPGPPKVSLYPRLRHADILLNGPLQDQLVADIIDMAYG